MKCHYVKSHCDQSLTGYLASLDKNETTQLALEVFRGAKNMTDQFAALVALAQNPGEARNEALSSFYEQWKDDALVCVKSFHLPFFEPLL